MGREWRRDHSEDKTLLAGTWRYRATGHHSLGSAIPVIAFPRLPHRKQWGRRQIHVGEIFSQNYSACRNQASAR